MLVQELNLNFLLFCDVFSPFNLFGMTGTFTFLTTDREAGGVPLVRQLCNLYAYKKLKEDFKYKMF